MNKIQNKLYKLLVSFDHLCSVYGLHYQLAWGTLLGAVRHHGFIPWDDDVDVVMPLEDYRKLLSLDTCGEAYWVQSYNSDRSYFYLFAKFRERDPEEDLSLGEDVRVGRGPMGVWLDIFPLIPALSTYPRKWERWKKKRLLFANLLAAKSIPFSGCRTFKSLFGKCCSFFIPRGYIISRLKGSDTYFSKSYNTFYCQDFWSADQRLFYQLKWIGSSSQLTFETLSFPCPSAFEEVLTYQYGDYMKLPDVAHRASHFGSSLIP